MNMLRAMRMAIAFVTATVVAQANTGASGGECPSDNEPPNVASLLQSNLQMNKQTVGGEAGQATLLPLPPRKVWWCGYDETALAKSLWPERTLLPLGDKQLSSEDDVLVIGRYGMCTGGIGGFKGKVLYVNGEVVGDSVDAQQFQIGAVGGGPNELQVYFAAIAIGAISQSESVDAMQNLTGSRPHKSRDHFMLYISSDCVSHREAAFDQITAATAAREAELPVAGGKCHGTTNQSKIAGPVPEVNSKWESTMSTYAKYKFALTMENTVDDAYITEKIVNAFLGGAVPVYYGTSKIFELFNREAFIFYDPENPDEALKRIEFLDTNQTAYAEVVAQPILADGALEEYFSLSDDVGGGKLKQRIQAMVFPQQEQ